MPLTGSRQGVRVPRTSARCSVLPLLLCRLPRHSIVPSTRKENLYQMQAKRTRRQTLSRPHGQTFKKGLKAPIELRPTKVWPKKPYVGTSEALFSENAFLRRIVQRASHDDGNRCCAHGEYLRDIKVHSTNANGIRARIRKGAFECYLRRERPDVLLIQEFRCDATKFFSKSRTKETLQELGYGVVIINTCEYNIGYAGTAILSRVPILSHQLMTDDEEGRVIAVDFGGFTMVNIYSPNSGRPLELKTMPKRRTFETKLRKMILQLQKKQPVLAVGDLNVAYRPQDVHEQSILCCKN
jgi:hypothetical protein